MFWHQGQGSCSVTTTLSTVLCGDFIAFDRECFSLVLTSCLAKRKHRYMFAVYQRKWGGNSWTEGRTTVIQHDKVEFLAIQCDSHLIGLPPSTLAHPWQPIARPPLPTFRLCSLLATLMVSHHFQRTITAWSLPFPGPQLSLQSYQLSSLPIFFPIQLFLLPCSSSASQTAKHIFTSCLLECFPHILTSLVPLFH